MRICLVFDCLYPYTVGGGERWYRALAEGLAGRGLGVTYLTRLQWDPDASADVPGVDVVAVAPAMELYADGRRSISVQLRFALGVFRHLVAHGGRYDVVQTPALHVSLLAVLAARPFRRFRIVVDWFEVWTREYWLEYLGGLAGRLGWLAERLSARSRHEALCFSRLHAERLERLGHRGRITIVEGLAVLPDEDPAPAPATPLVVFAGRHIPRERPRGRRGRRPGSGRDPGAARRDLRGRARPRRGLAPDRGFGPERDDHSAGLRRGRPCPR